MTLTCNECLQQPVATQHRQLSLTSSKIKKPIRVLDPWVGPGVTNEFPGGLISALVHEKTQVLISNYF